MEESDLIPISALQHYRYCPRQCALIHIDGLWAENRLTAEGLQLHKRVDTPGSRARTPAVVDAHEVDIDEAEFTESGHRGVIVRLVRAMPLLCMAHGIVGKADSVEIQTDKASGQIVAPPKPIEYKRGKPKRDNTDAVQLCAQVLCLEEMTSWAIPTGELFYNTTRKRQKVAIDTKLRKETIDTIKSIRAMIEANHTPFAEFGPKCRNCSLLNFCLPKGTDRSKNPSLYLTRALRVALGSTSSEEGVTDP